MMRFKGSLLILTAALFLFGGAFVFASGQNEAPGPQGSSGTQSTVQPTVGSSLVTVAGQIQFVNRVRPVVTSGSVKYELIVPRYDVYQSGVSEGQTITVKGYKVEGGTWGPYYGQSQPVDNTPKLLVSSATIGGKSYDLQNWADHFKLALQYRGTFGPRAGFRGPGYGPMMGYGPRGRGDYGRGPGRWSDRDSGRGFGRGYGQMYGPGYGPMFGPGYGQYGPGMGYGFQGAQPPSNQGQ